MSIKKILFYIFVTVNCFLQPLTVFAIVEDKPVLIISSYNPDAQSTSTNISDFIEEFTALGGTGNVLIENMNCKSFSESVFWKGRMTDILLKYQKTNKPALIVLLGQEAWASFLSQKDTTLTNVPVMCAMASKNAIILPDSNVKSLDTWMPESVDLVTDSLSTQVKGGFVYDYDIEGNVNLIKKLYPQTENVALITDNSYGGVAMQAYVRKEMLMFPDLNLILIDGREHTIYTLVDRLGQLPYHTALLMGTWRVDKNDGYFMKNSTYSMMDAVPHMPVFSISSIGFGYWAIGGIMPMYRGVGKDMAKQAIHILSNPDDPANCVQIIPNKLKLDYNKVKELKINVNALNPDRIVINETPSFYQQYKYEIWSVVSVVLFLLIALLITMFFYVRTKRFKDALEISGEELRLARDKAEESNRLKSAFLANMSHEIRTPLNSIVGFSNVLATGESSKEEQKAFSEIIQLNSDLLLRLINDILDISRLETDRVSFAYEKVDVVQLANQVLATVSYTNKTDNRFVFESDYESFEMKTDVQRMQQVIINLLSNAGKFTKNGTITLSFQIDADYKYAQFSVSDTGTGIPLEKQKLVFERFEKLNEYAQGTGLGLSICKLIVEKWKGEIWIDPEYTGGARFVFTHPIRL